MVSERDLAASTFARSYELHPPYCHPVQLNFMDKIRTFLRAASLSCGAICGVCHIDKIRTFLRAASSVRFASIRAIFSTFARSYELHQQWKEAGTAVIPQYIRTFLRAASFFNILRHTCISSTFARSYELHRHTLRHSRCQRYPVHSHVPTSCISKAIQVC